MSLNSQLFDLQPLPAGYSVLPWSETLLDAHADAKYRSFSTEIDANVFACLGEREGCRRLMNEIIRRDTFVPSATWLLRYQDPETLSTQSCGTIQGLSDQHGFGAIQNVGVTPTHRDRGLGRVLIHRSLSGFKSVGLERAYLEVTAQNTGALRLYERLGFRRVKTVYKAVEVEYA